jgi:hypothetical protein
MEGQLLAMWPFLVMCPHMGQRRVGLCEGRRVLWTPHDMNSCLCVNWVWVREVCFIWNEKSHPSRREGAVFGGLRKCCMSVFDVIFVRVCFEVGVHVGCGIA